MLGARGGGWGEDDGGDEADDPNVEEGKGNP